MDDFDQVPKPPLEVPYKYRKPLPKTKRERKQLPAFPCPECQKYFDSFPDSIARAQLSCRHRDYHARPPSPEGFWEIGFPPYSIPLETHRPKPISKNKYRACRIDSSSMYDGLNIQLVTYFDPPACRSILAQLEKEIVYLPPDSCRVHVKGKSYRVPRRVAAYGDVAYSFSGTTFQPQPFTDLLKRLEGVAFQLTGERFNFALVNRYKDGTEMIGYHKDDEPDLDPTASIVSFSFGADRRFVFKRLHFPNYETILTSGSVLVMRPPTNTYWYHGLPEHKEVKTMRVNITFRRILSKD